MCVCSNVSKVYGMSIRVFVCLCVCVCVRGVCVTVFVGERERWRKGEREGGC